MSGWEDEKVDKWKSLLFDWRKKWENKKGNLYKLIYLSLLKKLRPIKKKIKAITPMLLRVRLDAAYFAKN